MHGRHAPSFARGRAPSRRWIGGSTGASSTTLRSTRTPLMVGALLGGALGVGIGLYQGGEWNNVQSVYAWDGSSLRERERYGSSPTSERDRYGSTPPGRDEKKRSTSKTKIAGLLSGLTIVIGGLAFVTLSFVASRFRRCPPNKIMVISGKGAGGQRAAKTLHGGGAIVMPIWQEFGYISLDPMQITCDLRKALSLENIRINCPSVFTIAVTTDPVLLQNAAQRLLGLSREEIASQARDIMFGQLRQVIASMRIEEINKSREKFTSSVSQNIETELQKLGLTLINVNITDLTDESGYLEAMGRKAAREAIESARIDESEQAKRGSMGVASNVKEKDVFEAEQKFLTTQAIAQKEQSNRIAVAEANSSAIEGENKARTTVAQSEALLKVRMAEAYQKSRLAEVRVEEETAKAEARAEEAKAHLIEASERTKLEAPAKAKKAEMLVEAQAEAERMRILAQGKAAAVAMEAEAVARAEAEKLRMKGEGLGHIIRQVGSSEKAFQLMLLEHIDQLAEASSKAISNIKFDKVTVWDGGQGESTSNFVKNVASSLPPAMHMLRDVAGVDLPKYIASFSDDAKPIASHPAMESDDAVDVAHGHGAQLRPRSTTATPIPPSTTKPPTTTTSSE